MRQSGKYAERPTLAEDRAPNRIHLPVRWIVPSIGNIGGVDYEDTLASYGESRQLMEEVTDLCAAFHPTSQLHSFPHDNPVFLFWQARSTGDWIICRVTVSSDVLRDHTTLDYHCLVFDTNTFHALRFNPFRTRSLNLHERLRAHLLEERTDTFSYTMPMSAVPSGRPLRKDADTAEPFDVAQIPGLSADLLPNEDNLCALQEYCSRWVEQPTPPPTFATWWVNEEAAAKSYFNVVLSVPGAKAPTLSGSKDAIFALTTALKAKLPSPSIDDLIALDLVQSILNNTTGAENAVSHASAFVGVITPQDFQAHIIGVKLNLSQLSTRIGALLERFDDRLTEEQAGELQSLADQCDEIAHRIQAVRHPEEAGPTAGRGPKWPFTRAGWDRIVWRSPFNTK